MSVTIPNTVKTIGSKSFYDNEQLVSIIISESVVSIGKECFWFTGLRDVTCLATTPPSFPNGNPFQTTTFKKKLTVPAEAVGAYLASAWVNRFDTICYEVSIWHGEGFSNEFVTIASSEINTDANGQATIIRDVDGMPHKVILNVLPVEGKFTSREGVWDKTNAAAWIVEQQDTTEWIVSAGSKVNVLADTDDKITVKEGGELVTNQNLSNVVVEKRLTAGDWNFMGFPIRENNGISCMLMNDTNGIDCNIWALGYDYANNTWEDQYLHWSGATTDRVEAGNGIFAWTETDQTLKIKGSVFKQSDILTITKEITANEGNRWVALANPYTEKLPVASFNNQGLQGNCVYIYENGNYVAKYCTGDDAITPGQGFFVNLGAEDSDVTIAYVQPETAAVEEYIELSVITDGIAVPVRFAVDESANVSFDRLDANKLFGDGSVAEPFFAKDGYKLCKEVVNQLPYTAALNVRSSESCSVEIVANYIPEAYDVVLIDGYEETVLENGTRYSAELAEGDNTDRFSLKISRNAVSIQDIDATNDLNITNNNRIITVTGGNDLRTEVFNALGQKVYETTARTFELNGVAAGAYVVKVKSGSVSRSSKLVVR